MHTPCWRIWITVMVIASFFGRRGLGHIQMMNGRTGEWPRVYSSTPIQGWVNAVAFSIWIAGGLVVVVVMASW
jgi:hypothetical protein